MPELTLGKSQQALISYASPERVSYGMPDGVATGIATVAITADSAKVTSSVNIVDVYPNLFAPGAAGLTATLQTASNQAMLSIYGSGLGHADTSTVTATIGGEAAAVSYARSDGSSPGLDRYDLIVPPDLAGMGAADVVVKVNGKASNPVSVTF